jgi:hypothetical protein
MLLEAEARIKNVIKSGAVFGLCCFGWIFFSRGSVYFVR